MNLLRNAIESTSASAVDPMVAVPVGEEREARVTCPHRGGRREALGRLQAVETGTSQTPTPVLGDAMRRPQEFIATPTSLRAVTPANVNNHLPSPERQDSIPSNPNPSTENLVSDNTQNEERYRRWCWKCKVEGVIEICERVWMGSLNCFCFVCCGFDLDDCYGHGRGYRASIHDDAPHLGNHAGSHGYRGDGLTGGGGGAFRGEVNGCFGGRDVRGNGGGFGGSGGRVPSAGFRYLDGAGSPEVRGPRRVVLGRRRLSG